MNKKDIRFILIFSVALIILRLILLLPTTDKYHLASFRIGTHPVNDGLIWLNSAKDILENRLCEGRPLFPLLLALLLTLFKSNFALYFSLFILLNVAALCIAVYLLKNIRNNIFIVVFLAFLSAWNIPLQFSICTENLAVPFMIVALALLIKGLFYYSYNYIFISYFFIALSQTIRPWDFFSLVCLPLFPLFYNGITKKTLKLTAVLFLAICLGISCYTLAAKMFSFGQSQHVFALKLWAQGHGGGGEMQVYRADPEVVAATLDNIPDDERLFANGLVNTPNPKITKVLLKNALQEIKAHPQNLLRAYGLALSFFARYIPYNFSHAKIGNIFGVLLVLFTLILYFYDKDKIALIERKKIITLLALAAGLLFFGPIYFCIFLAALGVIYIVFSAHKKYKIITYLFVTGILVSLFFNGGGGGDREWLSKEALLFYFSAFGAFSFSSGFKRSAESNKEFSFDKKKLVHSILSLCIPVFFIFILIPSLLRLNPAVAAKKGSFHITKEQLGRHFGASEQILSPKGFVYYALLWPNPSFETVTGHLSYWTYRHRSWNTFFFAANEGALENNHEYWPLMRFPFKRTVDIYNRILFPFITQKQLARFEDKQIVVLGRILGRPRPSFTSTGYIIIAQNIGYINDTGQLEWLDLKNL